MKTYQTIRHACLALAALLLLPLTLRAQGTQPTEGDGSEGNPYQIATADNLRWFNTQCNTQPTACAVLTEDIDMESLNWTPVSNYSGTFDGQGHTLKNLKVKDDFHTDAIGLFGQTRGAKIRNIVFESPKINIGVRLSQAQCIGFVAGYATYGTVIEGVSIDGGDLYVQNYDLTGYDQGESYVGSIAGLVDQSEIRSCTNSAALLAPYYCGGIAGGIGGTGSRIVDCANHGQVTGLNSTLTSKSYIGGIAGIVRPTSELTNLLNTGNIKLNGINGAGLFVGKTITTTTDTRNIGGGVWLCGSDVKITHHVKDYEWPAKAVGNGFLNSLAGLDITTIVHRVTQEQLKSGEAAWLLNGQTATPKDGSQPVWQQRLAQDAMPEPRAKEGGIVYYGKDCQTQADSYTNDGETIGSDGQKHQFQLTQTEGLALYRWVCTACQYQKSETLYIKDFAGQAGYNLPLQYNSDASFTALEPVHLADATAYNSPVDFTAGELTYSRPFPGDGWQPLFLPFDLPTSLLPEGVEVAVLNNFHEYKSGGKQAVELEVRRVVDGSTVKALTPCVIRSSDAQPLELHLSAAAMVEAKGNSIDCWSMKRHYTFTGTMEGKNEFDPTRHFVMKGGHLYRAATTAQLRGQRWYLTATDRTGSALPAAPQCITIKVADDDATAIDGLHVVSDDTPASEGIYDLQGRRLTAEPQHGVYIKNGRKHVK